jgi:chaperone modulatory protein CbpM
MTNKLNLSVEVLDESCEIRLAELCQACAVRAETIIAMVEEGLLEPRGSTPVEWRFSGPTLRRVEITLRLQQDLRVNLAGAALAVELLEEIERLQDRLQRLDENR